MKGEGRVGVADHTDTGRPSVETKPRRQSKVGARAAGEVGPV